MFFERLSGESWYKNRCRANLINCQREPEKMVRKAFVVVALVIIVFSLVGCHTLQGLGDDIKWIGEKGEEIVER